MVYQQHANTNQQRTQQHRSMTARQTRFEAALKLCVVLSGRGTLKVRVLSATEARWLPRMCSVARSTDARAAEAYPAPPLQCHVHGREPAVLTYNIVCHTGSKD